jgi:hypothetical protein
MSAQAVENRIEDLRQLYRLMLSLREVRLLGPLSDNGKPKRTTP